MAILKNMSGYESLFFHSSQYPAALEKSMHDSLKYRKIDSKFHYLTYRQSARWLKVHQTYSPWLTDKDCQEMYQQGFKFIGELLTMQPTLVVSLGCGNGQKDGQLLRLALDAGAGVGYVAVDAAPALVLEAALNARETISELEPLCVVCDLLKAENLHSFWEGRFGETDRKIFLLLGLLPNMPPEKPLEQIRRWMKDQDLLMLSANLAPGRHLETGCKEIISQYHNPETRRWLETLLDDLDIPKDSYDLNFCVRKAKAEKISYGKIIGEATFTRNVEIEYCGFDYPIEEGEKIELFYSNRFQPEAVNELVEKMGYTIEKAWVAGSEEEGIWILKRN